MVHYPDKDTTLLTRRGSSATLPAGAAHDYGERGAGSSNGETFYFKMT